MSRQAVALITVLAFAGIASRAEATEFFSGSTSTLSAAASFTINTVSGPTNQLVILLTNTDTSAPLNSASVLSGLYFNLGTATLTPVSAATTAVADPDHSEFQPGSVIQASNCDMQSCIGATNVGGEWSYASGGANGIELGLVPNAWTEWQGNGGLDQAALIEATVMFVLDIPDGLTEEQITNVYFTYGTTAGENSVPGRTGVFAMTGAFAMLSLLGGALVGAGYSLRRRSFKS